MAQTFSSRWNVGWFDHALFQLNLRQALLAGLRPKAPKVCAAKYRDRSRYSGALLRALRAERGCGRPPKVLAARRAKLEGL